MKPTGHLSFLIAVLALHINLTTSHTCVHDQMETEIQTVELPYSQKEGRMLGDYQSLRIFFDYSNLVLADANLYDYIVNELMPPAKNYFGAALKVPQSTEKFKIALTKTCSGTITIPAVYNDTGVDADLVIFVTAAAEVGVDYVAFSSICLVDSATNRPVGGRLHFNTNVIQQKNKESQREGDMVTSMHEITHILGFSNSVYDRFIDPTTGKNLTGHTATITVNGISTKILKLNSVISKLKDYFGCDTVQGAYLENEGASGSKNSHLERRIFFNEYMTASRLNDARITEFTLAILEGSGWYQVDYSMAEPMTWGKGKGCDFLNGACIDTSATPRVGKFDEFCSPFMERGCSWTGREGSMCGDFSVSTSSSLATAIDWWGNKTVSRDPYSDNCPIYQAFSNTDCEDVENIASAKIAGSASGYGSKCFMGTLSNNGAARPFGSYCFKATCETYGSGKKRVNVQVGGATGICEDAGDIGIAGVTGTLTCPDPVQFCNVIENEGFCRRECMSRGSCVNKNCQCQAGWGSMDCGKRVYTECDKCKGDASKPSCYGDTCACNPADTRCNGSGLTVVEIVGIAIGVAVFLIAMILVIRYRKAIMARLRGKKATGSQQGTKRVKVDRTPSSAMTSPGQKKEMGAHEDSPPIPSPTTRHVNLDFNDSKNAPSPVKQIMGSRSPYDTFGSPRDNGVVVQEPGGVKLKKKESDLRTIG